MRSGESEVGPIVATTRVRRFRTPAIEDMAPFDPKPRATASPSPKAYPWPRQPARPGAQATHRNNRASENTAPVQNRATNV